MGTTTHSQLGRESAEPARPADEFLPLVYDELRRLAAAQLARERPGQTLQPTALVHEAWLKLSAAPGRVWEHHAQFLAAASEAMRRILIDRARRKLRPKHGHGLQRVSLDALDVAATTDDETLLAIDDALDQLQNEDPIKAQLVKLRFFVGLPLTDAGRALGLSESTAKRHWNYARAFLLAEIRKNP